MKEKEICYIDCDGVIADFCKAIIDPHPDLNINMDDHDTWRDFVDEYCEETNPHVFRNLELLPMAKEAVGLLNEKYNIYFLTTPMWNVPFSYTDKRLWLEEHFGDIAFKKLILSHNKGLCMGKYLIDDTTRNGVLDFKGEHIHFGSKRFPDWDSILKYVL
jgi:5'-nucleotidase